MYSKLYWFFPAGVFSQFNYVGLLMGYAIGLGIDISIRQTKSLGRMKFSLAGLFGSVFLGTLIDEYSNMSINSYYRISSLCTLGFAYGIASGKGLRAIISFIVGGIIAFFFFTNIMQIVSYEVSILNTVVNSFLGEHCELGPMVGALGQKCDHYPLYVNFIITTTLFGFSFLIRFILRPRSYLNSIISNIKRMAMLEVIYFLFFFSIFTVEIGFGLGLVIFLHFTTFGGILGICFGVPAFITDCK